MKIRHLQTRFILAGGLLVMTTVVSGIWSAFTFARLSKVTGKTQQISQQTTDLTAVLSNALEREDDALLLAVNGERDQARPKLEKERQRFAAAYTRLLKIMDRPDEKEAAAALQRHASEYRAAGDALLSVVGQPDAKTVYYQRVNPALRQAVEDCTKIRELNFRSMELAAIRRVALETRRRVKEQQKRVFKSEFRNTHFSYILGADGIEQFVSTPELHSDEAIESDPLPPGQVWAASTGSPETGPGLYRIEVTCGPGGGVKILNQPTPPPFRESVRIGEQNLYARAKELVGDRNPREEEFSVQMRPMDADKSGTGLALPMLVALCGALLARNTRGGAIIAGALNLGGSIETIPNAVRIAELAVDKQAQTLLMPVSARRQLNDLPDDLWTKVSIEFYKDATDAVFKALTD